MRPKRDPIPRAKEAWVWLGGVFLLGLLGAGAAVAAVLLWENVDIRQLTPALVQAPERLPEPEPARPPAIDGGAFSAVLFDSDLNRSYFPDAGYHPAELRRWRGLIGELGGTVRDAGGAEALRSVTADELLVLVEAPCLTAAELAAIRAHVQRGGSVVSNWAVGVRDAECEWRGWDTLLELTEAEEVQELPAREALFMTVPAGIALAAGLDPGTRIELRPDPSLALRVPGPRVYWSDWALNPAPDEGGLGADVAAITTRTPEGGRTAWFGLRVSQAVTPADSLHLQRLVQNGVLWAAGKSVASPAAWPGGAQATLVLSLDVEDEPRNALDVAALFEAESLPATFFAVTQLVTDDPELGVALARAGEVGSQTADHTPLAGLAAQDQAVRLRRSFNDIERWAGTGPVGLRPPEEAFDSTTLRALRDAGGEYLVARNDARSASPEVHGTTRGPVVLLPRLLKDDYNVIVQDGAIRAERISEAFLQGTRKLHAIGGLAVVAGHTQIMRSGRRVDAFRHVADSVRSAGDWWIAPAADVARWWRARAGLHITFSPPEGEPADASMAPSGHSDLLVRGTGGPTPGAVWIDLVIPAGADALVPLVDGRSVGFAATDWGIRVPVGPLTEGVVRRISLARLDGRAGPTASDGS